MGAVYTIKAFPQDGGEYWIHNPAERVLITGDPWFEVGDNINGSAEFDVYPEHPFYDKVKKLTTDITFYKNGDEIFSGRVLYDNEDFSGTKHVVVEGELGYLNDSIQRPAVYHDTPPKTLCQTYIDIHNSQVENRKKFVLGQVTVEDSNDSLYRYSNYETTRESFDDKLVSRLGGHLKIRKEEDNRILDYLSDDTYYRNAKQTIEFGANLLDYAKNVDATDLITCLIPLGAQQDEEEIEGLVKYLTIEDVNGGVDYVTDDAAVAEFGRIFGTNKWDDVTLPENLKTKAEEYLKGVMYENLVLELTAVDLNLTDDEIEGLEVGMRVRCISEPHGMDAWYPISKMRVYLMDAEQNMFTLGEEKANSTYTSSNRQTNAELTRIVEEIPTKGDILRQALADATDLINSMVASGYAIHEPNEFIVADDPDYKNQAKNLWRWGLGGLAHYSDGYYGEADGIALTMDGHINGKMLLANSVVAEAIDFGYTEMLESEITEMGEEANEYTRSVQEVVTNSITNLDNRIALTVVSTKEAIVQKNYIVNGETETIDLDSWYVYGSAADVTIEEYQNVNCIKVAFKSEGRVDIEQVVGTGLPNGNYTAQMEVAFPEGKAPSYVRHGLYSNYQTTYMTGYDAEYFTCLKTKYEYVNANSDTSYISEIMYCGVYGYEGDVLYIKNIRLLRNMQELLDDISSSLTVEVNKIQATVTETYENVNHDYCLNGNFTEGSDGLDGWSKSGSSVGTTTFNDTRCCNLPSNNNAIYQTFENPKQGRVRVSFKAACADGTESDARVRVRVNNTYQNTSYGDISGWTDVTFDFEDVPAGTIEVRIYNYGYTALYITDVQILASLSYYTEAQLTIMSDSIVSEVTRATNEEEKLTSRIEQLAGSITLSIEKGELGNVAEIILSVDGAEKVREEMDLGNVRQAFANEDSYCLIAAGTIAFASGHLLIDSKQFNLDSSGNATFSGNLSAPSGDIGGFTIGSKYITSGPTSLDDTESGIYIGTDGIHHIGSGTQDAYFTFKNGRIFLGYNKGEAGYISGYGYNISTNRAMWRMASQEGIDILAPFLRVSQTYYGETEDSTAWEGATGSIDCIYEIIDQGSGSYKWSWKTLKFCNGILYTTL